MTMEDKYELYRVLSCEDDFRFYYFSHNYDLFNVWETAFR